MRPYDGYIVDSVGWAYYRLGRYDDAAKTLEAAVLLVPGDPTINDHLGDALVESGPQDRCALPVEPCLAFSDRRPSEKAEIEQKLKTGLTGDGIVGTGRAVAPAKINLFLHVGDKRADGFHPLQSLAVFTGVRRRAGGRSRPTTLAGDRRARSRRRLHGEGDNLVLRAARALAAQAGTQPARSSP